VHAATTAKFLWISLQFLLRGSEAREGTGPEKARVRVGSLGRSDGGSGEGKVTLLELLSAGVLDLEIDIRNLIGKAA